MASADDVGEPLLYTYQQARKKLGVSLSQLYILMKAGEIKPLPLGPQVRRISSAELQEYVNRLIAARDGKAA